MNHNFLKEYTRKYGNLVSINEDKFSYDNQEQNGSTSSRKQDQASGFRKFKPPENISTSYRTPSGNNYGVTIKYETLANNPINSDTPESGSKNHESLTNDFINYEIPYKFTFNNRQVNEDNGSCQIISEPDHKFPKSNGIKNKYLEISNYILIESKYEPPRLFENINDQFDNFLAQCNRFVFINNMIGNSVPLTDIDKQIKNFSILHDKFIAIKEQTIIEKRENYVKERVYLLAQQVYAKILAKYNKKGRRKKNKYYKKKNPKKNRKIGLFRY
ncbi:hypothetical protein C1646_662045 [Rhizophagus diaphanus]|nr:hypothetical protein C1646_662045 [Rhizophagus diaphanus] [Rhizophagus sp. MUCL 43196]